MFSARRNPGTNLEVATLLEGFLKKSADFDSRMYQQGGHFQICAWVAPGTERAPKYRDLARNM
jgi:hypothetical protein